MLRGILACTALLALGACTTAARPEADSAAARGHQVARHACVTCHAVEPGGASPNARAPGFASLEMRHTAGLEGRVSDLTRLGHYGMPPVKLSPQQVRDIVAYIESLGG